MMAAKAVLPTFLLLFFLRGSPAQYTPDWKSLDSRPLPGWYDDAKIGIFLHWGVFSVPSYGSEWFWNFWQIQKIQKYIQFMGNNFKPGFTYQDFASSFTAEFYDPDQWADIFNASGARYVVLTSKHHEGFTLWPSKVSWSWNAMDVGPRRDLLGDLATAVRKYPQIHFGLYHSLFEWFNPIYLHDKANGFRTKEFVKMKTIPELYELVMRYKPEVIWSDGAGEASSDYFSSKDFLTWLYNESPVKDIVVTNDRWGNDTDCKHGGYYSCMDRYNPGKLVNHKWENAMTIDQSSWGFRRDATLNDIMTIENLIALLAETVSCGGNLLVNIGPTHDGRVVPIFEERLRQMGSWLKVNGEAIYGTQPWKFQNDTITPGVWYTSKMMSVYAIFLQWPKNNTIRLGNLFKMDPQATVSLLGVQGTLSWKKGPSGETVVTLPFLTPDIVPCQWAWTIKVQDFTRII